MWSRALGRGAPVALVNSVRRTLFAMFVLVVGCVMPQHRGVATFCNGYVFSGGLAIGLMASSAESNPNSWRDLDHAAADLAAAMMLLGLVGQVLTVALHHDDPPVTAPVQ